MKYFETLYKISPQKYEFDSPIFLCESAIIKDNVDNEVLLRNIMRNIGNDTIIAVDITIQIKNVFEEIITDNMKYVYQDICVKEKELFGNQVSIKLPDEARKIIVDVNRVIFDNGVIWNAGEKDIAYLQEQNEIQEPESFINEIMDSSKIERMYYYVENESCWQCTCGQPNALNNSACSNCGASKEVIKKYLCENKIKTQYATYKKKKEDEEQSNSCKDLQKRNSNYGSNIHVSSDYDNTANNKKMLNLLITPIMLAVVVIVAIVFLSNRTYDKKISVILEKGIEKRDELPRATGGVDQYETLVNAEADTLKYVGKKFENENYRTYTQGLNDQNEALKYYDSDNEKFGELWNQGQQLRYDSVMQLVKNGEITLSDKVYSHYGINMLADSIGNNIDGDVEFKYDDDVESYYLETTVNNNTNIPFENVIMNLIFGDSVSTLTKDRWGIDETWDIKVYLDEQTIKQEPISLNVEFVRYKYNEYEEILLDQEKIYEEASEDMDSKDSESAIVLLECISDYSDVEQKLSNLYWKSCNELMEKGDLELSYERLKKIPQSFISNYSGYEKIKAILEKYKDSKWIGEWESPKFSEHRITKIKIENEEAYLAAFYEGKNKPFDEAPLPDSGNIIYAFTPVGDSGYEVSGDLRLKSDDCIVFPYWDGGSNEFTRVGSSDAGATASQIAEKKSSDVTNPNECDVDGCNKKGINEYAGLSGKTEYYCDEHYNEMMDIIGGLESDVGSGSASKHQCEVSGCNKEGTYDITGISGQTEYYCTEHYNEMVKMLEKMRE